MTPAHIFFPFWLIAEGLSLKVTGKNKKLASTAATAEEHSEQIPYLLNVCFLVLTQALSPIQRKDA